MTAIVLYDDDRARKFEPFALTRPAGELRAGALLVRERWSLALGVPVAGFIGAPHLSCFDEDGAPRALDGIARGAVVANSRFAPALVGADPRATRWIANGKLAAVRVADDLMPKALHRGAAPLESLPALDGDTIEIGGWWLDEIWSYITLLGAMLNDDIPRLASAGSARRLGSADAILIGSHPVFVEEGAMVEPQVCFDTTLGPVLVRATGGIQAFTRIVGPCYIGEHSLVSSDRVSGCSIGPHCRVHGEISVSIFLGYANKGHDGFVGHSYFGRWANLGAETVTSNLKNTYGSVSLWTPDGVRDTNLQFLGTFFGDHTKTGINVPLTTGTVLGAGANVMGAMPPKAVPPFAWGQQGKFETYRLDKFLEVAARVMARRSVELSERTREQLAAAHAARWKA
jgi:UDP-N-acetylglucosamine diphosphorylase/glucosamine-1-phosphate N-acetyltransferase